MRTFLMRHKVFSSMIILAILGAGYFLYTKSKSTGTETRYVVASVAKGAIIVSVSGSGQVTVSNQLDVKPKASGDIIALYIQNGKAVRAGEVLVALDSRDAQKSVRDAEANLAAAKLNLEKIQQPADTLSILQSENALLQAKESKQKAGDDLTKAYEDGFNTVVNAFLDLPVVMAGLYSMLYSTTLGGTSQWNLDYYANAVQSLDAKILRYKDDAAQSYQAARIAYDQNLNHYKAASRFSDRDVIESLIDETYNTTRAIAEAIKNANNLIQFYQDKLAERSLKPNATSNTHLSDLNGYTGKTNTYLSNLLVIRRTIQTSKEALVNADRSIAEKTASLEKLKVGALPLDLASQELSVQQRQNALRDAREKLADYVIRAPFDGIIAKTQVKRSDAVSPSTTIATLITRQRTAQIALNEIDVAKVQVGEKATLTFDAVPDLSIAGSVVDVDTIGAVTQGVVTYGVTVGFDTQDDRVKPGMSLSVSIITNAKQDVLTVPASAVKMQGGVPVVQVFDAPLPKAQGNQGVASVAPPRDQVVQVGLSSDTAVEIISGLSLGDQVVTRTITGTSKTTATPQAPSLFGAVGGNRGGGGMRMPRD